MSLKRKYLVYHLASQRGDLKMQKCKSADLSANYIDFKITNVFQLIFTCHWCNFLVCSIEILPILPHLSFSNHISNLSRSCFMHIRDLRRIQPMRDFKTASTIATSIVHSKLDYCNSLFLNLDSTQIQRLQSFKTHSHALSPERPGIIISLLSLNHFTG